MKNTFFPHLFPGEHVLSMFARRLRFNVLRSVEVEQRALTSTNVSLTTQSILSPALQVVLKSINCAQERERILKEHSLMGFYSHSLNQKHVRDYLRTKGKAQHQKLKAAHCSKLASSKAWRWCNECVKEDTSNIGVAYWHVAHQLPTAITCPKHTTSKLLNSCSQCGFAIRDLKKVSNPSECCSVCRSKITQSTKILGGNLRWVQDRGLELHRSSEGILNPGYKYDMNHVVGACVSLLTKGKRLGLVQKHIHYQPLFSEWALKSGASCLFDENFSFEYDNAVSLHTTINTPTKVSPLSHLLWLRFFGVDSFGEFNRW
ncbi:hypothetical protein GMES_0833 [Paraglaciecola mesophila KMM 241]|uniref:TniQ domain-containing protein n=1 Tax=Paraglaciecola mesophila KMM 241 TaxID=1128912 RepID=K6Z2B3_9ALTE|nr:TniQ family protein [Paraglaciecola mesophila]GAC23133.1 hypothetical protein GMES_0833 [Paraglaciecola mesophila KMM 241]